MRSGDLARNNLAPQAMSPFEAASKTEVSVPAPRKALRVVLRQDYPDGKPQDVGDFAAAAQSEIAAVLGLPANSLQVLYVFGDGAGNVSIDISLVGNVWGQEAVAAAQLAAYVGRGGIASIRTDGTNGEKKRAMLVGAEVQLLLGTPWEEVPPVISSPMASKASAAGLYWDAQKPRPQLDPEVEKLLDDASRLVKDRPATNSRLKMLEIRQKQRIAVRKLEDRWWAKKERRLHNCAITVQRIFRGRRMRRMVWLYKRHLSAQKIQAYYRGYRLRKRIIDVTKRLSGVLKIQAWWRGCRARWRLYRTMECFRMFWRCVIAKIMALELKSWFLCRRKAAICIQTRYRGYAARKELRKLRFLRREKQELALWIQSCFIGYLEGEKLQEEYNAAVVIQSSWRKYVVRLWARKVFAEENKSQKRSQAKSAQKMVSAIGEGRMKKPLTQAQILQDREQDRLEAEERRKRLAQQRKDEEERSKRAMDRAQHQGEKLTQQRTRKNEEQDVAARMIQKLWRLRKAQMNRAREARLRALEEKIGKKAAASLPKDLKAGLERGDLDGTGWQMEELSEYEDEEEVKPFKTWDKRLISAFIELSPDLLRATHRDDSGHELQGVVFGNGPLPKFKGGMFYFEVEVKRTVSGAPDGLTVGVTTRNPWAEQKLWMVAAEVPDSWIIGLDGVAMSPSSELKIDFHPSDLKKGDRVGLLITKKRQVICVVNNKPVGDIGTDGPPKDMPLYPFIDVLGNTRSALLIPDASPPDIGETQPDAAADEDVGTLGWLFGGGGEPTEKKEGSDHESETSGPVEPELSFDHGLASRWVKISDDGMSVRSIDAGRDELYGVVFGSAPLKLSDDGLYFEVKIEEVVHGCDDGLAIGVTKERPGKSEKLPKTGEDLQHAWSLGYNGSAVVPGQEMTPITWHPTELRKGDRVGLHVNNFGEIFVIHNNVRVDRAPDTVPVDTKLYPFVDLLGNTVAVALVPNALPPKASVLRRFDKRLLSPHVQLLEGGVLAQSDDPTGKESEGVIYGDAPLPKSDKGFYFEVRIEEKRAGQFDGLVMGVTTSPPKPSARPLSGADELPNSWSFGYDGAARINGLDDLVPVNFKPQDFEVGDRIGFLVTPSGEMIEFVNDKVVVRFSGSVPVGAPLYAVVDLLGAARAVRLLPDAQIPDFKASSGRAPDSKASGQPGAPKTGGPAASTAPPPKHMTGFDARALHSHVEISSAGLKIEHMDEEGKDLFGVAFGNAPLAVRGDGNRWFEVIVDSVSDGPEDGMAIGVTTVPPSSWKSQLPELADRVPNTWLAGYEGLFIDTKKDQERDITWNPADLKIGDKVGVLAKKDGDFVVLVRGHVVVNEKQRLPGTDKPLYAIVDLIGRTRGVTFLPKTDPPEISKTLTAFDTELASKYVVMINGALQVTHKDKDGDAGQGGVFTNGVLPTFPEGDYFEVKIEALRPNAFDDGLVIGVTTEKPKLPWKVPDVMDVYRPSWSGGYDGQSNNNGDMQSISWSPVDLKVGDHVGILVTPEREVWILQNGNQQSRIPGKPPDNAPLYGFVDLIGKTLSVSLMVKAQPPGGIQPTESSFAWLGF